AAARGDDLIVSQEAPSKAARRAELKPGLMRLSRELPSSGRELVADVAEKPAPPRHQLRVLRPMQLVHQERLAPTVSNRKPLLAKAVAVAEPRCGDLTPKLVRSRPAAVRAVGCRTSRPKPLLGMCKAKAVLPSVSVSAAKALLRLVKDSKDSQARLKGKAA